VAQLRDEAKPRDPALSTMRRAPQLAQNARRL
jgi:hypothetical protein